MKWRTEKDSLGEFNVPGDALFGIHTSRAHQNFGHTSGMFIDLDLIKAITHIKIACAHANMSQRMLDRKKGALIISAAKEILDGKHDSAFVLDAFGAGGGTPFNMNVNEVIANLVNKKHKLSLGNYKYCHPNDDVNMGQSTNDVMPTAFRVAALHKLDYLEVALLTTIKSLRKKTIAFKTIRKSGRTHLQDAVPIVLGAEFASYQTTLEKNLHSLKHTQQYLLYVNLGGNAIGSGINTKKGFGKLTTKYLAKQTKLKLKSARDLYESTAFSTDFVSLSSRLKELATSLIKICNDLRLLASGPRTGLHELNIPAVEPGSSIMPGKVNPSMLEYLTMICFQVVGNDTTVQQAAAASQLELNVFNPVIYNSILQSLRMLTMGLLRTEHYCIRGIQANKEVCEYYLENSAGLATALNPIIGYDRAARIAQQAVKEGKSIKDVVLERHLMSEKQFKDLVK